MVWWRGVKWYGVVWWGMARYGVVGLILLALVGVCPSTGLGGPLGAYIRLRKGLNSAGLYGGLPLGYCQDGAYGRRWGPWWPI